MRTNTVRKFHELHDVPQFSRPKPILVDVEELAYWTRELEAVQMRKKDSNRQRVNFLKKGALTHSTVYQMVERGIPGRVLGLHKIEKIQDYAERLDALRRLGALARIFASGATRPRTDAGFPVMALEEVTDAMVRDEVETVLNLRHLW